MKKYLKPDFTIQMFEVADIITTSVDETGLTSATVSGGEATWDSQWNAFDIAE